VSGWIFRDWSGDPGAVSYAGAITPLTIREQAPTLKCNKTCGRDFVVAEMIFELDEVGLIPYRIFQIRFLDNTDAVRGPSWNFDEAVSIQKKLHAKRIKDLRPIAKLSVCHKLYSMVIAAITNLRSLALYSPQFAFRATYSAEEVIGALRRLIELGGAMATGAYNCG
jgi:hypothetical protein